MLRLSKIFSDFAKRFPLSGKKALVRTVTSLHGPRTVHDLAVQGNVVICLYYHIKLLSVITKFILDSNGICLRPTDENTRLIWLTPSCLSSLLKAPDIMKCLQIPRKLFYSIFIVIYAMKYLLN